MDLRLDDGRTVRLHDSGARTPDGLTLIWHHGSPQTGAPLDPLLAARAPAQRPPRAPNDT